MHSALQTSTVASAVRSALATAKTAAADSRTATAAARLGRAVRQSAVYAGCSAAARHAVASRTYRWLTADPDPQPVELDLRGSRVLAAVLALGTRLGRPLARVSATVRTSRPGRVVADSGTSRALAAFFEPPARSADGAERGSTDEPASEDDTAD